MAIKIKFDAAGNPEPPILVLATRSGDKFGQIPAGSINIADYQNEPSEIQFQVHKYDSDGELVPLWDELVNFRLVWCQEWDVWFEATVSLDEDTETVKTVNCTRLGQAELSQIMLYDIEINTEDDIARDDYERATVFYSTAYPEASLLDRIMEKAPHYSIAHVDDTLVNIQRTFSFDGTSLYDAFQEIATEIGCLFVFDSESDDDGKPTGRFLYMTWSPLVRPAVIVVSLPQPALSAAARRSTRGMARTPLFSLRRTRWAVTSSSLRTRTA